MRQFTEANYDKMCERAAQHIADVINREVAKKGHATIGLATGSTPIGVYAKLVELYKAGKVDFDKVITFNLDEYIVDPEKHPRFFEDNANSYHRFMWDHLFSHIVDGSSRGMKRENINIPDTRVKDYSKIERGDFSELKPVCDEYEAKIKNTRGGG